MTTPNATPAAPDSNRERVYDAVLNYQREHGGTPPTVREIAARVGIDSTSVVNYHLTHLAAIGRIEVPPENGQARPSRGARISGAMWLEPEDVIRVARLVHTIDDARRALEEHGAAVIDAVIADLERALDAHTPIASVQNGRAA